MFVAEMGVRWRQFAALVWKNYRVQRKKPFTVCCLLFGPGLFSALILFLHVGKRYIVVEDTKSWMPEEIKICSKHGDVHGTYCVSKSAHLILYYAPAVNITRAIMGHINEGLDNTLSECELS